MINGKQIVSFANTVTSCIKKSEKASMITRPQNIKGINFTQLSFAPLVSDVVEISSSKNPIATIYNYKQKFGQFMSDYHCAYLVKNEFKAFKNKDLDYNILDLLYRDKQLYKNVGQNTTSKMEEILVKLQNSDLKANEKEALYKEFETLCNQTLARKDEFKILKEQLKQLQIEYTKSLDKCGLKPAREIENPSELVRTPAKFGEKLPKAYIENSKDVRQYFNNAIDNGKYLESYDSYVETMNKAHKLAYSGNSGKNLYYIKDGEKYVMEAGKWREVNIDHARDVDTSYFGCESISKIANKYNDPLNNIISENSNMHLLNQRNMTKTSKVKLKNIPEEYQPSDSWKYSDFEGFTMLEKYKHKYAPSKALGLYHQEMYRTAKEVIDKIKNKNNPNEILESLAEHFQYAANARPYKQINNSLYMNEVNTLLQRAGMNVMPHVNLDLAAQRLQPESFKKYFIDMYYKNSLANLNLNDVAVSYMGI